MQKHIKTFEINTNNNGSTVVKQYKKPNKTKSRGGYGGPHDSGHFLYSLELPQVLGKLDQKQAQDLPHTHPEQVAFHGGGFCI